MSFYPYGLHNAHLRNIGYRNKNQMSEGDNYGE